MEALTDSLRMELSPAGVGVGCAYFGIIDTDLGRSGKEHPTTRTLEHLMPAFARRAVPVSEAVDAIERAALGRRNRVWAPRYVGPALLARGLMQPLLEQLVTRDKSLRTAIHQANAANSEGAGQDPLLGIAIPSRGVR